MSAAQAQGRAPIEFWFDFASGYAYFAALEIEALAERHGRTAISAKVSTPTIPMQSRTLCPYSGWIPT
jgi:2-hydroxychromene-2-carboxylate isomerase